MLTGKQIICFLGACNEIVITLPEERQIDIKKVFPIPVLAEANS